MRTLIRNAYHLGIKLAWLVVVPLIRTRIILSGNPPLITCDRSDGGGAQLHGRISTIAFAETLGLKYAHTPLSKVHFMETDEEVERWNTLIKFSKFWPQVNEKHRIVEVKSLSSLLGKLLFGRWFGNEETLQVEHCHAYTDRFPKRIAELRPRLRSAFEASDLAMGQELPLQDVVIHFRGLVGPEDESSPRLSSNSMLRKKITIARNLRKADHSLVICVNPTPELRQVLDETFVLDAGSDVQTAFMFLARAKVAILARSSLSYVAALLNPNTVFYETFWHPKMPDWKSVE